MGECRQFNAKINQRHRLELERDKKCKRRRKLASERAVGGGLEAMNDNLNDTHQQTWSLPATWYSLKWAGQVVDVIFLPLTCNGLQPKTCALDAH